MPAEPRLAALVWSLSRRERQIMDIVYREGRATAALVHGRLPEPPCSAAVRTMLRILEEKGHLWHEKEGPRHVYYPTTPRDEAQTSALRHLTGTFFGGSRTAVVAALLDESERPLSASEREELSVVITRLRETGQ